MATNKHTAQVTTGITTEKTRLFFIVILHDSDHFKHKEKYFYILILIYVFIFLIEKKIIIILNICYIYIWK